MEEEAVMSRIPIRADDPDLGHLAGAVIVEGSDRVTVERIIDGLSATTAVKSVRLPVPVIRAVENVHHPSGFTGVVHEALLEWFERHGGTENELNDARHALEVLQRVLGRMESA